MDERERCECLAFMADTHTINSCRLVPFFDNVHLLLFAKDGC